MVCPLCVVAAGAFLGGGYLYDSFTGKPGEEAAAALADGAAAGAAAPGPAGAEGVVAAGPGTDAGAAPDAAVADPAAAAAAEVTAT
mmetsp:Transcript_12769/g.28326  ORF Transcript_12769/g.28326 Transcript_12769/m.28326 type:complete len:86 (-) Transcript_12769:219-476(-)